MERIERISLARPRTKRVRPWRCGAIARLRRRWAEHRELRRWFRDNPPEVGRSTGCRV